MDIIDYQRVEGTSGYVDHAPRGKSYIYQIVPTTIKKEPEFLPALRAVFGSLPIEVLEPEDDFPAWTVTIKDATNPWAQADFATTYPQKLVELLDRYY